MKKITVKKIVWNIPNSFIASAYAGAVSERQTQIHGNFYGGNFKKDFRRCYKFSLKFIKGLVSNLPDKLSLKKLITLSPANNY